jgi:hypothetical protein
VAAVEEFQQLADYESGHPYVRSVAAANYSALTLETTVQSLYEDSAIHYRCYREFDIESFLTTRFFILHKIGQPTRVKQLIEFTWDYPEVNSLLPESLERTVNLGLSITTPFSPVFIAQALTSRNKFEEAAPILIQSPLARKPRMIAVVLGLFVAAEKPNDAGKHL